MTLRWALVFAALVGCSPRFAPVREAGPPLLDPGPVTIERISLKYSNVYLLRAPNGAGVGLVDAGSPSDTDAITKALAAENLRPSDVRVVVLTHGHGDHAGLGKFFQTNGAKIIVGRGDELQTAVGRNDEMTPTSLFARVLKPFVRLDYAPFTPDVLVDEEIDLAPYGLRGVGARHMPGHTRGSLVVMVGAREAIVGDQMLGGVWGGTFHEASAGDHYYQLDPVRNHANIQALVDGGVERFHLGHGGPVTRDAVIEWLR